MIWRTHNTRTNSKALFGLEGVEEWKVEGVKEWKCEESVKKVVGVWIEVC